MISSILALLSNAFWIVVRFLKHEDAVKPQNSLDKARTDAATDNDDFLNADLDAANDRLRDPHNS